MSTLERLEHLIEVLLRTKGSPPPNKPYASLPRLATVDTPRGTVYVKETEDMIHVSTPAYSDNWSIYELSKITGDLRWDMIEARSLIPLIERELVLDLLAE